MKIDSLEEILRFAIRKEADASLFYKTLMDRSDSGMKKAFQELAEMEEEHRKKLEGFDLKNVGEIGLEEAKGLEIAEMMEDIPFSSEMSYAELIRVAIKQEEKSEHLYLSTEKLVKEPKLKRLLLFLAQEETGHKLRLEKIYDEEILKEF